MTFLEISLFHQVRARDRSLNGLSGSSRFFPCSAFLFSLIRCRNHFAESPQHASSHASQICRCPWSKVGGEEMKTEDLQSVFQQLL